MNCPKCNKEMSVVTAGDDIEIDVCDDHGIWFDTGELWELIKVGRKMRQKSKVSRAALKKKAKSMANKRLAEMCNRAVNWSNPIRWNKY